MKTTTAALVALLALTGGAFAAGSHAGGHGEAGMMAIGKPGKAKDASRTVTITMMERDDGGMVFEPASLAVSKGETLRLKFVNEGELDHGRAAVAPTPSLPTLLGGFPHHVSRRRACRPCGARPKGRFVRLQVSARSAQHAMPRSGGFRIVRTD